MGAANLNPATQECDLVEALRRGDPDAAETLVRQEAGKLLAVTQRITGNEHDARDAVQEAFAIAFARIHEFDGRARVSTWLFRIAVNVALEILRRRNRRQERSIEELLPVFHADGHRVDPRSAWPVDGYHGTDRESVQDVVRRRFAELPPAYAEVLYFRDVVGMDTAETAEALAIEPGAVKTRLHRARQALRTLLEMDLSP